MSDRIVSSLEMFRAVYAHMLADWCREASLAKFDQLIEQVRRAAKTEALREFAWSLDFDAIATEWSSNDREYWAADGAARAVQKDALERADLIEQEHLGEQE